MTAAVFHLSYGRTSRKSSTLTVGISEEEIQRTCAMFDDCGDCPLKEYCESEVLKQN